jgi:hypothetical protein
MRTVALVDLLRKTLIRHGHIMPTSIQSGSECTTLNQGEYLVSLLSHDESLLNFLSDAVHEDYFLHMVSDGNEKDGLRLAAMYGVDFSLWADAVKFTWINIGTVATLEFIRGATFQKWSLQALAIRHRFVDDQVLLAQKKLRASGVKYRQFSEFFADTDVTKVAYVLR